MARDEKVFFWSGSIWKGRNWSPSMCFHVSDWFWQRHLSFALGVVQGTKTSGTTTALQEIALVKFQRCVPIKSHRIPCNPGSPQKSVILQNDRIQLNFHNVVVQSQYFRSPFGPRKAFVDKFQIESKHKDRHKFRSLALHGLLPKFRKVSKFIPRAHDYFIWGAKFIFPNQRLRGG